MMCTKRVPYLEPDIISVVLRVIFLGRLVCRLLSNVDHHKIGGGDFILVEEGARQGY